MTEENRRDGRPLFRPSSLPNDREYEKAAAAENFSFSPSPPPKGGSSGEAESEAYNKARFDAKTEVVKMTPELLRDYKNRLKSEIDARQIYGIAVFFLVVIWLVIVTHTIRSTGLGELNLDSAVLVALTTGVTISIVGLLGTVITYFFAKSNEQISLYKQLFQAMIDEERGR